MLQVIAYIDGFNLYHGLRSTYGRRYLWLDLERLCTSLLLPTQELARLSFFTAPVRRGRASILRQDTYLSALAASCPKLSIEFGRFQKKMLTCRSCGGSWSSYEEKQTDVGIAVSVVMDAANNAYDTALLVSADGDLCPAVAAVRKLNPSARVVAAFPPSRRSDEVISRPGDWR